LIFPHQHDSGPYRWFRFDARGNELRRMSKVVQPKPRIGADARDSVQLALVHGEVERWISMLPSRGVRDSDLVTTLLHYLAYGDVKDSSQAAEFLSRLAALSDCKALVERGVIPHLISGCKCISDDRSSLCAGILTTVLKRFSIAKDQALTADAISSLAESVTVMIEQDRVTDSHALVSCLLACSQTEPIPTLASIDVAGGAFARVLTAQHRDEPLLLDALNGLLRCSQARGVQIKVR
jgi:hypothetical protein